MQVENTRGVNVEKRGTKYSPRIELGKRKGEKGKGKQRRFKLEEGPSVTISDLSYATLVKI